MPYRKEKLPEILKQLAAEFVEIESSGASLVTITGADISDNQRSVKILFTVLPEDKEKVVGEFLNRKRSDFLAFIEKKARIGRMPHIEFMLDVGEKNRQRIDFLLKSE
jgi:ribosome-binding factor A